MESFTSEASADESDVLQMLRFASDIVVDIYSGEVETLIGHTRIGWFKSA